MTGTPLSPITRAVIATQLRLEALVKLYESSTVLGDQQTASILRGQAHETLDSLLDAKTALVEATMKSTNRKP